MVVDSGYVSLRCMVAISGSRVVIIITNCTGCTVGLFQNVVCGGAGLFHIVVGGSYYWVVLVVGVIMEVGLEMEEVE